MKIFFFETTKIFFQENNGVKSTKSYLVGSAILKFLFN